MRDGIITFESEADAQRYGALLEAEGHLEVRLPSLRWAFRMIGSYLHFNHNHCSEGIHHGSFNITAGL
jgi:hypothetical protein